MKTINVIMPPVGTYWEGEGGFNGGIFQPRDGSAPRILIYDIANILESARWGKTTAVAASAGKFDGAANTRAILEADPDNVIAKHITSLEIDGHRDFFWPAIFELTHLFVTAGDKILDALPGYGAWSSSQPPGYPSDAYVQYFDDGGQFWYHKDDEFGAVAVRSKSLNY
ncbi:hypothetical protein [Burkholderia sp. BCC1985]|uniref:hypothetical protein n=1 Tax=Burkholderia sp. BCC1985 TaxID=2817442 RepID=UPI002AB0D736|nr:hypothetical protein [Burkholderia sp. BCC1985]